MHQEQPMIPMLIERTFRDPSIKKGERLEAVAMATGKTDLQVRGKVAKSQLAAKKKNRRTRVIRIRANSPAQKVMLKKARSRSSKDNSNHQIQTRGSQILESQIQVIQSQVIQIQVIQSQVIQSQVNLSQEIRNLESRNPESRNPESRNPVSPSRIQVKLSQKAVKIARGRKRSSNLKIASLRRSRAILSSRLQILNQVWVKRSPTPCQCWDRC